MEVLTSWVNLLISVVNGMFALQLFDGLYLGYLMLGVLIMGAIVNYFWRRLH